jgi:hypothetical protein
MHTHDPNSSPLTEMGGNQSRRRFLHTTMIAALGLVLPTMRAEAAKKPAPKRTVPPTTAMTHDMNGTSAAVFDAGYEVAIAFTYQATAGRRMHNPYTAVYVQDAAGKLVRTIDVAYKRDESKYLRQLSRWFKAQSTAGSSYLSKTTSGPTRLPGTHSFSWNGLNDSKQPVVHGDYVIYIEAARENGPYQSVSQPVTIGPDPFTKNTPGKGDLQAVTIDYRKRA